MPVSVNRKPPVCPIESVTAEGLSPQSQSIVIAIKTGRGAFGLYCGRDAHIRKNGGYPNISLSRAQLIEYANGLLELASQE